MFKIYFNVFRTDFAIPMKNELNFGILCPSKELPFYYFIFSSELFTCRYRLYFIMSRSKFTNHIRLGLNEIGKDMDFNIEGSHDLWSVKTRDSGE